MGEEIKHIQQSIRGFTVASAIFLGLAALFGILELTGSFPGKVTSLGLYLTVAGVLWQVRALAKTLLGAIERLAQST